MATVTINVGGRIFITKLENLKSVPDTKLAGLSTACNASFDKDKDWFFFDRNSTIFEYIIDLYRTGSLHVPHDMCGGKVIEELEFWEIPLDRLEDCCYDVIRKYKDDTARMTFLRTKFDETVVHFPSEQIRQCRVTQVREKIWSFMEYPETSRQAMVYAVIYYMLVLLTCVTFVLNTHPAFRVDRTFSPVGFTYVDENNVTQWIRTDDYIRSIVHNPKQLMYYLTEVIPAIYAIDVACYLIFTVDLVLRFLVSPSKKLLLESVVIYFDIILVITNTVAFALEMNPEVLEGNESLANFYVACKCCVILRLCRLFKLIRHLSGLKVLMLSFKTSFKDLCQLALPLMITILLMSGIMYYAEFQGHHTFSNIPITIWWCVVTMTTVGYGDVTPTTHVGYTIASLVAIFGLILIAMPVAIIASNFDSLRNLNSIREQKDFLERERSQEKTKILVKSAKVNKIWFQ